MSNSPESLPENEERDGGEIARWESQSPALPADPVADAIEARLVRCLDDATEPEEIERYLELLKQQRAERLSQLAQMYSILPEGRRQALENRLRINDEVRTTVAGLFAFLFGCYLIAQGSSLWGIPIAAWGILQWADRYMQQETLNTVKALLERNRNSEGSRTLTEGFKSRREDSNDE